MRASKELEKTEGGSYMERRDKVNYYLDLAEMVSQRSTCLRKHYGAVIVNNDEVISTGYVGAPRGRKNCSDIGRCIREELHVPRGERYGVVPQCPCRGQCPDSASRERMIGASLYLTGVDARTGGYVEKSSCCSDVQAHGNQCRN